MLATEEEDDGIEVKACSNINDDIEQDNDPENVATEEDDFFFAGTLVEEEAAEE